MAAFPLTSSCVWPHILKLRLGIRLNVCCSSWRLPARDQIGRFSDLLERLWCKRRQTWRLLRQTMCNMGLARRRGPHGSSKVAAAANTRHAWARCARHAADKTVATHRCSTTRPVRQNGRGDLFTFSMFIIGSLTLCVRMLSRPCRLPRCRLTRQWAITIDHPPLSDTRQSDILPASCEPRTCKSEIGENHAPRSLRWGWRAMACKPSREQSKGASNDHAPISHSGLSKRGHTFSFLLPRGQRSPSPPPAQPPLRRRPPPPSPPQPEAEQPSGPLLSCSASPLQSRPRQPC